MNKKSAPIARFYGLSEAYAANIYNRPPQPQQEIHILNEKKKSNNNSQ